MRIEVRQRPLCGAAGGLCSAQVDRSEGDLHWAGAERVQPREMDPGEMLVCAGGAPRGCA